MPMPSENPLRTFTASRCEHAFRQLVEQHTPAVHAAALRMLHGNEAQARDVTQSVFVELARRASGLPPGVVLGAWLHRVTCAQAAMLIRTEVRRRRRESTAAAMHATNDTADAAWREIAPVLDEELNRLPAADRDALALRFLENHSLRDVGTALGTTEDGARKRVARALERLRLRFVRRGIAAPGVALLSSLLAQHATVPAHAAVIASATSAGLAAPAANSMATAGLAAVLWKTAAVLAAGGVAFAGARATAPPPVPVVSASSGPPPPAVAVRKSPPPPPQPVLSSLVARLDAEDAMLARIATASAAELKQIFDEYVKDFAPHHYDLLFRRWAMLDSAGALHHLRHAHEYEVSKFYRAWAGGGFDIALASARKEASAWKGDSIQAVLGSLVPADIEKFLKLAAVVEKPSHVNVESMELAMRTLAADGMEKALAVFAGLKAPHLRGQAARTLAALKAAADPTAAITWSQSLPTKEERTAALTGTVQALLKTDPARAATLLPLLPEGQHATAQQFSAVARAMVERDAAAGLTWALENMPASYPDTFASLLNKARSLPVVERLRFARRFRERILATAPDSLRHFERSVGGHAQPADNPDHAADLRALADEPADALRNVMLSEIAFAMKQKDLPGLLALLPTLPPEARSAAAARCLVFSGSDPAALVPLLDSLTHPGSADEALRAVFMDNTREAVSSLGYNLGGLPAPARDAALAQVPAMHRVNVIHGMASKLASSDTESAIAWSETLPPADQPAATSGIVQHMAWDNELAASEWIDAMPRGDVRDAATGALCERIRGSDSDSAWQWALSIGDPALRVSTLGGVYHHWAKKGAPAAAAALRAAPLTSAERSSVQQFKP
jgi:RNA polymerase sigma factor (sigma-70 family)